MDTPQVVGRVAIESDFVFGLAFALAVALVAWVTRSLTRAGAFAAVCVGGAAAAAGGPWVAILLGFFVSATLLSRLGREEKSRRIGGVVAKGGARDQAQVLANGAVFALSAIAWSVTRWEGWIVAGAGALAAACADTVSTELGTLARRRPRLITSGRRVAVGTSGGVTAIGFAGALGGAAFIAAVSRFVKWPSRVGIAAAGGGIVGALADSFIGALWQTRRRCPRCDAHTERAVHDCGAATVVAGGLAWLDNDWVNLLCTAIGAVAALVIWSRAE